jgi:hypothetical protein
MMSHIENKIKLKHILGLCKCDHKKEINKEPHLKDAHMYCKINQLPGQVSGLLIENYIKHKYTMVKNKPELCIGDLRGNNQTNIEIKVSIGGKDNNRFNYVQLRMNHICEYILTAYYVNETNIDSLGELFIFRLKKDDIKSFILKYGSYAHGTKKKLGPITQEDLDDTANNKEYAIRPTFKDKCWQELLEFRITELCI